MWITVTNTHAKLTRSDDEERGWLRSVLSWDNPKARFIPGAPAQHCMFNLWNATFPAGLVDLVRRAAKDAGQVVELVDQRTKPCEPDSDADLGWLRDYQKDAVAAVIKKGRGLLWMPTGAGKTEVIVGLTRALPTAWLLCVHRVDLMDQAARRYELRTGLGAGRIGEGQWDIPKDTRLVCATFQTLANGLKNGDPRTLSLLAHATALVVDETHTLPASTFARVVNACSNAYYRVGVSGTPLEREDKMVLIGALGPVLYRLRPEVLIKAGVLARPTIKLLRIAHQAPEQPTWQGVYGAAIVRSARRNALVAEAAKRADKPCLVFVKEIRHGKALVKMLEASGVRAAFTWGSHSIEQRTRAVRDLVAGRTDVLVCSVIFQEGIDIPSLRSVVIASGGKSVIATLQRIGRGMRVSEGKSTFEVFDIADYGCSCMAGASSGRHKGCKWLERHTQARVKAYTAEGHQTTVEDWAVAAPRRARAAE